MNQNQTRVKKWMQDFGQETPDKPMIPSDRVKLLRAKLIFEEALETIEALGIEVINQEYPIRINHCDFLINCEDNITAVADGLADLEVVLLGTAIACGIDLQPCFDEVMRSNDSKAWSHEDLEAEPLADGSTLKIISHGKYLVKRADGKVLKSPSYTPANLAPIIEAQSLHLGSGMEAQGGGR